MRYQIKRECWNEKTYNGYTDNPYWKIDTNGLSFGLNDDGELWCMDRLDVSEVHKDIIRNIIKECKLSITLIGEERDETIKTIKRILNEYGCFSVGELDEEVNGICVSELGNYVGLAEYFTQDYVEVNVYEPSSMSSDEIDSYEEQYENLNDDVLKEILFVCEIWEAEQLKTEKRISN